jgi:hypothetical protein
MDNQITPATGTVYLCIPLSPHPNSLTLKPVAHICTANMAEEELSAYSTFSQACPELCNEPLCVPLKQKVKQDSKPFKIYLIKYKVTFTLVYNDSKYISCHKDTEFGV